MPMYDAPVVPSAPSAPLNLQAGSNVTIDHTDPTAPIISVTVPPGTTRESFANIALGSQNAAQSGYTYYSVASVAQRGIVSRMVITPSDVGSYDIEVRNSNSGTGEKFLDAKGQSGAYDISMPFYFENNTNDTFYVGIRNNSAITLTFTLTTLRVERLA